MKTVNCFFLTDQFSGISPKRSDTLEGVSVGTIKGVMING